MYSFLYIIQKCISLMMTYKMYKIHKIIFYVLYKNTFSLTMTYKIYKLIFYVLYKMYLA